MDEVVGPDWTWKVSPLRRSRPTRNLSSSDRADLGSRSLANLSSSYFIRFNISFPQSQSVCSKSLALELLHDTAYRWYGTFQFTERFNAIYFCRKESVYGHTCNCRTTATRWSHCGKGCYPCRRAPGIPGRVLAAIIGVSEATVSRMKTGDFALDRDRNAFELSLLFVWLPLLGCHRRG